MTENNNRKFKKEEVLHVEQYQITTENIEPALKLVTDALSFAWNKYPWWPISLFVGNTIIGEEYGEAMMATLDAKYKNHPMKDVIAEHAQSAAMHIRHIQHLLNVEAD